MKNRILVAGILVIALTLITTGCTDILTQQKVGGFGDAQKTPAVTTPAPGMTSGLSASSGSSIADMRQGSIYATCYPACTRSPKKSVDDCDKACCLAQCQPRSPDDTKRCAGICGVELEKVTSYQQLTRPRG